MMKYSLAVSIEYGVGMCNTENKWQWWKWMK